MSLKHGILGLLKYEPATGYEIDRFFKESLSYFWQAQTSQIYREINKLEKDGLATSEVVIQYDSPNKKVYHITEAGCAELKSWLQSSLDDNSNLIRSAFLMRVFFSAEQAVEENIDMLQKFIDSCKKQISDMSVVHEVIDHNTTNIPELQSSKIYWDITADFGFRYYQMCIEWAENALSKLNNN